MLFGKSLKKLQTGYWQLIKNIEGQKIQSVLNGSRDITVHEDLCKLNERLKKEEPVKIVYLAAYHNPDLVLANPHIAWNINITALSDFLNTVENVKCLFYSSTEMVYKPGEMNVFFKEDTEKKPINAYGSHKMGCRAIGNGIWL